MSWLDKINTDFKITTGDTAQYYPYWVNANRSRDFNYTEFLFKNVEGSLVDKRLSRGRRYNLEIMFQGEDYLDVSDRFDKSSRNSKAWTIEHPLYGQLVVQPIGMQIDNSQFNVTKITTTIIETIGGKAVNTGVTSPEKIQLQVYQTNEVLTDEFASSVPDPNISILQSMAANVNAAYEAISSQIAVAQDAIDFTNTYNEANSLINNTVFDVSSLIGQIQSLMLAPATFVDTVVNRVLLAQQQFAAIIIPEYSDSPQIKQLYQNNAAMPVLCMCLASVTQYDYSNREQVINTIDTVIDTYNAYIDTIDTLQTSTGGDIDSYIPTTDVVLKLSDTVTTTVAELYNIADQSKQQRTVFLTEDMTLVQATHKYFGLSIDDSTITDMIAINNIGRVEYLLLKKNRKITYNV